MPARASSSLEDVSAPTACRRPEVWALLAGCALAAIYLAIRFGVAGGVAALAACLLDALTGRWRFPPSSAGRCRWRAASPRPSPLPASCSLLAGALALEPLPRNAARSGRRAPQRRQCAAPRTRAPCVAARSPLTAPLLLASLCMLALGPAGVRAMGLPLLAGALSALVYRHRA